MLPRCLLTPAALACLSLFATAARADEGARELPTVTVSAATSAGDTMSALPRVARPA